MTAAQETSRSEVILQVGYEGGSITLLRERSAAHLWKFRVSTDPSQYVNSFPDALALLDKYSWFRLTPLQLHPDYRESIVRTVAQRTSPLEAARWLLRFSGSVAVLTGAGVSAESGIPTFRSHGGYWRNLRFQDLATPEAFARDPKLVWT